MKTILDLTKFSNNQLREMLIREKENLQRLICLEESEAPKELVSLIDIKLLNINKLESELANRQTNK
jgi:hypothetical protein